MCKLVSGAINVKALTPAELFEQCRDTLYYVARKTEAVFRYDRSHRGRVEVEELVALAFAKILDSGQKNFDPARGASFATYVAELCRREMWLFAVAEKRRVSVRQLKNLLRRGKRPKHHGSNPVTLAGLPAREPNLRHPDAARGVERVRAALSDRDRSFVDLYLESDSNAAAVARRLGRHKDTIGYRYRRLFRRVRDRLPCGV
jgi:DNA-directed RNA polymerase specialized sigma24 family protein